jgi:hypothetical protein
MKAQSSLDELFYSLCEDYPGSVAVRQSFKAYQNCVELGLRTCSKELGLKPEDLDDYFSTRMAVLSPITDSEFPLQIDNENEGASEAVLQTTISQAHDHAIADSFSPYWSIAMTKHPESEKGMSSISSTSGLGSQRMSSTSSISGLGSEELRCHICHETFIRRTRLDAHINGHMSLKPYKCDGECGDPDWYAAFVVVVCC